MDITQTKELLEFFAVIGRVVKDSKADGRVDASDLGSLFAIAPKIGPAFDGVENIGAELNDLNEAEREDLKASLISVLGDDVSDRTEDLICAGFDVATSIQKFVKVIARKEVIA